jgi:hypothetical protein
MCRGAASSLCGVAGAWYSGLGLFWPGHPHDIFEGLDTPTETIATAFATGHHTTPTGYACGLLVAPYRCGTGRLILNTLPILENLGQHPTADRLLTNLICHAQTFKANNEQIIEDKE